MRPEVCSCVVVKCGGHKGMDRTHVKREDQWSSHMTSADQFEATVNFGERCSKCSDSKPVIPLSWTSSGFNCLSSALLLVSSYGISCE